MTRNLKALGLALVAALAMSAMAASAAQANNVNPQFTASEYPASVDATGTLAEEFTAFGARTTCGHAKFEGELTAASGELNVTPIYTQCHGVIPLVGGNLPATVTHNECDYRFHNPKTEAGSTAERDLYTVTVDIVCPAGKQIEVHIYGSEAAHTSGTALCTITVGAQTNLEGLTVDVNTAATPNDVTLTGTVTGIKAQQHRNSFLCPGSGATPETSTAEYHLPDEGVTAQGRNEAGVLVDSHIG